MSTIVLYMSMSLDGFITGPDDGMEHPLGLDGGRLLDWLGDESVAFPGSGRTSSGPSGRVFDEAMATGALISGRRTFELARRWNGDHHDGVPVFVLTHDAPEDPPPGSVQYVTDGVESCAARAKDAAGDRDVMVHGAGAAQSLLRAGLLDEMEIHLVPVLLGEGRRLFDALGPAHIELEPVRQLEAPGVTHLRYRISR